MMGQPVFHDEGHRIRQLANDPEIIFKYRRHTLEEMANDDLSKLDVESVLRRGAVLRAEDNRGEETWNVCGKDTDGRMLEIVVVAYESEFQIKVVSAWERKERRS